MGGERYGGNEARRGRRRAERGLLSGFLAAALLAVLVRYLSRALGGAFKRSPRPQHVLVVEDDPMVAGVLHAMLEVEGYTVRVAGDLASARAALSPQPDVILLDLNLPDGSGFDLLRHVREDLALTMPVVVLSGLKQEDSVVRALELGADDYVSKPFGPRELLARIAKRKAG